MFDISQKIDIVYVENTCGFIKVTVFIPTTKVFGNVDFHYVDECLIGLVSVILIVT